MGRLKRNLSSQKKPLKAPQSGKRPRVAPKLPPTPARAQRRPTSAATRLHQRRTPSAPPNSPPVAAKKLPIANIPLYCLRAIVLSIGLGAISGTLMSATDRSHLPLSVRTQAVREVATVPARPPALRLEIPSVELQSQVRALLDQSPALQAGVLIADLGTGIYLNIEGATSFAAASTIKLPILVAFFQDVDAGKIALDEKLTMTEATRAGEAGNMQYKKPGTQFSALETATQMITISDNTATNMLVERLGGAESLNQRFREWGLPATAIENYLPDVEGTNTTSPLDLAKLLAKLERGELVTKASRDRILGIMSQVVTNDLLPRGLDKDAKIAHKTGNIGSLVADAGIISTPTGKRYIAVVMVKRPHNDPKAKQSIRDISRSAYQYFNRPTPTAPATPTPKDVTVTPAQNSGTMASE